MLTKRIQMTKTLTGQYTKAIQANILLRFTKRREVGIVCLNYNSFVWGL